MNIVADSCVSTDISLILDQQLHSLQQQADNLQKQVNAVLEQVGLKRQQVARAMKALVETKSAVKECMKLVTEISEDARIPLQRELLELLEIPIASPLESPLPQPIATIHTVIGPEAKTPVISQVAEVPITAFLDHKDSETKELNDFDFLLSEPQTIVVRKVDSKVDIRKGIMGPILLSEDYLFLCRYQEHLIQKLGYIGDGYDTLLEEIGTDCHPKWQLLISHLSEEQAQIMNTDKDASLIAYEKNKESEKERLWALTKELNIDTTQMEPAISEADDLGFTQVSVTDRVAFMKAFGSACHCVYIGGEKESLLEEWGQWLREAIVPGAKYEVRKSQRVRTYFYELKFWGLNKAQATFISKGNLDRHPPKQSSRKYDQIVADLIAAK